MSSHSDNKGSNVSHQRKNKQKLMTNKNGFFTWRVFYKLRQKIQMEIRPLVWIFGDAVIERCYSRRVQSDPDLRANPTTAARPKGNLPQLHDDQTTGDPGGRHEGAIQERGKNRPPKSAQQWNKCKKRLLKIQSERERERDKMNKN